MSFTKKQEEDIKTVSKKVFQDGISEKGFMNLFADKLADLVYNKLAERIECLTSEVNELKGTVEIISKENAELKSKVDVLEQKYKMCQLRIYGLKERKGENLNEVVLDLFEDKKMTNNENIKLVGCYRIGVAKASSKKPRCVMVKFLSEIQRNIIFFNKKNLKNSKVVVAEDLTQTRFKLLSKAKETLGNGNVWSQGGNICTKIDGKKYFLKNEDDLKEIADNQK